MSDLTKQYDTVGRLLFGSGIRFRVAAWLVKRDDPVFYQDQYFHDTSHYTSSISAVLKKLELLDMIEKIPVPPGGSDRCTYWRRVDSPLWDVIKAGIRAIEPDISPERKARIYKDLVSIHKELR